MNRIKESIWAFAALTRRRLERNPQERMDCRTVSIRLATFLRHGGAGERIFRRQGRVLFDGLEACCRATGLHEWLEIPDLSLRVVDLGIGFQLRRQGRLTERALEMFFPLIIEGDDREEYRHRMLAYRPDPMKRFEGIWMPVERAFAWHLAPATDVLEG